MAHFTQMSLLVKKKRKILRRGGREARRILPPKDAFMGLFLSILIYWNTKAGKEENHGSFSRRKQPWFVDSEESFGAQQQHDICSGLSEMYVDLLILVRSSLSLENILKSTQIDWLKAVKSVESCVCKIQVMEINWDKWSLNRGMGYGTQQM